MKITLINIYSRDHKQNKDYFILTHIKQYAHVMLLHAHGLHQKKNVHMVH